MFVDDSSTAPRFSQPPVTEIAIAVEFVPIQAFGPVRMIDLHRRLWAQDYPRVVEQPPLPPPAPEPGSVLAGVGLQIGSGVAPLRLWMLSDDESQLLQLQHDRLILNWRKTDDHGAYPSYATLRKTFAARWDAFASALPEKARPTMVEVTFVNRLPSDAKSGSLAGFLESISDPQVPGNGVSTAFRYLSSIDRNEGGPGSVVVNAGAQRDVPATLTIATRLGIARADQPESSVIMDRLDTAHDLGVTTFVGLTPDTLHKKWGRTQ